MAKAIIDPAEVRRFASDLKRFTTDLQNQLVSLHGRFVALGDSWRDQEHDRFSDEFEQALRALSRFIEQSNQHAPYLMRKAQRIEDYLTQR